MYFNSKQVHGKIVTSLLNDDLPVSTVNKRLHTNRKGWIMINLIDLYQPFQMGMQYALFACN